MKILEGEVHQMKYHILGMKKIHYKYDSNGNMFDESKYDSKGSLLSKTTFKYDKKGNRIEQRDYIPDGSLKYRILFKVFTVRFY